MITTVTNYTDAHGITHASPVFAVKNAHCNVSSNESHRFNMADASYSSTINDSVNVNYSVQYWPSQESFDAGNRALDFYNVNGESSFYFNPEAAPVDLIAGVEAHFIKEIV